MQASEFNLYTRYAIAQTLASSNYGAAITKYRSELWVDKLYSWIYVRFLILTLTLTFSLFIQMAHSSTSASNAKKLFLTTILIRNHLQQMSSSISSSINSRLFAPWCVYSYGAVLCCLLVDYLLFATSSRCRRTSNKWREIISFLSVIMRKWFALNSHFISYTHRNILLRPAINCEHCCRRRWCFRSHCLWICKTLIELQWERFSILIAMSI